MPVTIPTKSLHKLLRLHSANPSPFTNPPPFPHHLYCSKGTKDGPSMILPIMQMARSFILWLGAWVGDSQMPSVKPVSLKCSPHAGTERKSDPSLKGRQHGGKICGILMSLSECLHPAVKVQVFEFQEAISFPFQNWNMLKVWSLQISRAHVKLVHLCTRCAEPRMLASFHAQGLLLPLFPYVFHSGSQLLNHCPLKNINSLLPVPLFVSLFPIALESSLSSTIH